MRLTSHAQRIGTLGFGLVGALLALTVARTPRAGRLALPEQMQLVPSPRSPSAASLRSARWARARAQIAVNEERERLEAWDEAGTATLDYEQWRLQLMARDRTGELTRARSEALRAQALARSSAEAARAAEQLVFIHHDLGCHAAELEQARLLAALQPQDLSAQLLLSRAQRCVMGSR
jgi:hypothetical protein